MRISKMMVKLSPDEVWGIEEVLSNVGTNAVEGDKPTQEQLQAVFDGPYVEVEDGCWVGAGISPDCKDPVFMVLLEDEGYVAVEEVTEGMTLITDEGFTCVDPNVEVKLHYAPADAIGLGGLYFVCRHGWHFLSGQLQNGRLIGLRKKV